MRFVTIVLLCGLGVPCRAQDAEPPAGDLVDAAMLVCLADGPHHRRCEPLAAIGPSAGEPLVAILRDDRRPPEQRILAAQALGLLGLQSTRAVLRETVDAEGTPAEVREAAENTLYLLGDTSAVDARIEHILTRYAAVPLARPAAFERLARTYAATGRFDSAARASRQAITATENEQRKRFLSYDLACYEALAGRREAALEAACTAITCDHTDLDWMTRDGDLRLLRDDPEFIARITAAKKERGAGGATTGARDSTPEYLEYRKFSRGYWDGDFEAYTEASSRYWEGYQEWLKTEGREAGKDAAAAWKARKGPLPEDPTPRWIARFREQLARHAGTALAPRIRDDLLTILANEDMAEDWTALFLEAARETPEYEGIGIHADAAVYWSETAGRREEMLAALVSIMKDHPRAPSAIGIRMALATERREAGDPEAARALYAEVLETCHTGFHAEEARGALYEMDHLGVGQAAPVFDAKDIRGNTVRLADLNGKVVLLDFWATWCGPCLGELPHVKRVHTDFANRDDFVLIGISLDADGIALLDSLEANGIDWPQVCGLAEFDDPVPRLYNVRGIPDTYLLDREGRIVARGLRGDELHDAVKKELEGGK